MDKKEIIIYTDGAARNNPGRGGYGVILQYGKHRKELSAGYIKTTNNRMELMAVIVAIEALKEDGLQVKIFSDSSYVVNAIEKGWLENWIKINFKKKKNKDLWLRYYDVAQKHFVKFNWVKGHADNPLNNRCDELATQAADGGNLLVDEGYESNC